MAAGLPRAAVHSQLASAVGVVVHLGRDPAGSRRVAEIAVLVREPGGSVTAVPAVTFAADGSSRERAGADELARRLAR